ncbi:cyclic peptide export ABC transporter [Planctobacterium marinum]|uniref:cyclic peptide export ABC transporter n=1 Tax=Planctobacterium marinum TaxID=1631968 RepID=UPI001E555F75|nr:cyclic peptide export ABC transporter [Planctobacterium marinum]MCC2606939.1 cyclic peptide export ABC transporter [Planctobacterium marinum]
MKILNYFSNIAPNRVFISIVFGAAAGICYSLLIPLVMESITTSDTGIEQVSSELDTIFGFEIANYKLALVYFFACLLVLVTRTVSEIMLMNIGSDVARDIRTRFYRQISTAPLYSIEQIGHAKLIAAINIDIPRIVGGARLLPAIFINIVTLLGMLGFLIYLNTEVFKFVMYAIAIGIVFYQLPMMIGQRIFKVNRYLTDELQESIRGLVYGAKELKLDGIKRENYLKQQLSNLESQVVSTEKQAQTIMRATVSIGDLISFFVIGFVCYVFVNYHAIAQQELVGVVMALLYITTPISIVINSMPQLVMSSVSQRKLNEVLSSIADEKVNTEITEQGDWTSFSFENVYYQYPDSADEEGFKVGPINLTIEKGGIYFIIGANGSGKSTLSKLLTMHYRPTSGEQKFDGNPVTKENIASYRQQIFAIYTDYYLFDKLFTDISSTQKAFIDDYLKLLELDKKVSIVDGKFSTTSLSDGQRKRLALLVAFLEDKSIYLFDEWAADQDPVFKKVFYTRILQDLQRRGKTLLIISHDERYFDVGDKIWVMEQGQLLVKNTSEKKQLLQVGRNATLTV